MRSGLGNGRSRERRRGWLDGRPRVALALVVAAWLGPSCGTAPDAVVVGSKNFSESVLLGEIVAQALEAEGARVERKLNLGGTFVCHQGLVAGELDVYVEYTGTAYAAILELPRSRDPARVRSAVDSVYAARWDLVWGEPLGFDNTYAMLIRGDMQRRLGITRFSEAAALAGRWRAGFGFEFLDRADGLPGLLERYGFTFDEPPVPMELGLMYRALAEGTVDLIAGNATDGQIEALDFFHLADDLGYFPPYEAVPVARRESLARHPELRAVLEELGGSISAEGMRRMNYLVDGEGRPVAEVAREFLEGLPR